MISVPTTLKKESGSNLLMVVEQSPYLDYNPVMTV